MAEELRNIYNQTFLEQLSIEIKQAYPLFDVEEFLSSFREECWQHLTLKERMRQITYSLHRTLSLNYRSSLEVLYQVAPRFTGLRGIIFPDYVEQFGLDDWEASIQALAFFTPYSTSEFAVRPFFNKNTDKMLSQMIVWSTSENEHIRRLSSEGSRSRLPWGLAVPALKQNPESTLPILMNLKEDESLYVRKSVANNINDLSYIEPEFVLKLANEWYGHHPHTNWIIKHACRSLLKKGNPRALSLFGFQNENTVDILHLQLNKATLMIGDTLEFSFTVQVQKSIPIRLEYIIDYIKANGTSSKKVFMISTFQPKDNETRFFSKKQTFRDLTTRKHYAGKHKLTILVNGQAKDSVEFDLQKLEESSE
jgi:3-methyladenine DNA glycosylase AlkC